MLFRNVTCHKKDMFKRPSHKKTYTTRSILIIIIDVWLCLQFAFFCWSTYVIFYWPVSIFVIFFSWRLSTLSDKRNVKGVEFYVFFQKNNENELFSIVNRGMYTTFVQMIRYYMYQIFKKYWITSILLDCGHFF